MYKRQDFIRTYEAVDRNFQEIFSILFPGGSANLSLVDPDDLENTGVEVNAQPKGKRIAKMMLCLLYTSGITLAFEKGVDYLAEPQE